MAQAIVLYNVVYFPVTMGCYHLLRKRRKFQQNKVEKVMQIIKLLIKKQIKGN